MGFCCARIFASPLTAEELRRTLRWAKRLQKPTRDDSFVSILCWKIDELPGKSTCLLDLFYEYYIRQSIQRKNERRERERKKERNRKRERETRDTKTSDNNSSSFFSLLLFSSQRLRITALTQINPSDRSSSALHVMNASPMLDNATLDITATTTIRTMKKFYVKNPFDSWYVGGILFMLMVILVLLYANFYRENTFQLLWIQFLTKIRLIPPQPSSSPTSSSQSMPLSAHQTINTLLVWLEINMITQAKEQGQELMFETLAQTPMFIGNARE